MTSEETFGHPVALLNDRPVAAGATRSRAWTNCRNQCLRIRMLFSFRAPGDTMWGDRPMSNPGWHALRSSKPKWTLIVVCCHGLG